MPTNEEIVKQAQASGVQAPEPSRRKDSGTGEAREQPYYDPSQRKQQGYNINDRAYVDKNAAERVPVGSVVPTADGNAWRRTGGESVPAYRTNGGSLFGDGYAQVGGNLYTQRTPSSVGDSAVDAMQRAGANGNTDVLMRQLSQLGGGTPAAAGDPSGRVTSPYGYTNEQRYIDELRQADDAARQQYVNQVDYNVTQGANALRRAEEDAQQEFLAQRNQVSRDERRALDNSALYAEARGDRGGIGQEQYGSIQNTAAQNRLAINQAQTKLATDTARQIEDLRAQGEFEKADKLLSIAQNELSQLMEIQKWAENYNLNIDQLNNALEKWEADFALQKERYSIEDARYADETAYSRSMTEQNRLASVAQQLMSMGIPLTDAQREALGYTPEQYDYYRQLFALQNAYGGYGGGGSGGGGRRTGGGGGEDAASDVPAAGGFDNGIWQAVEDYVAVYGEDAAEDFIKAHRKELGLGSTDTAAIAGWKEHLAQKNMYHQLTRLDYDPDGGTITVIDNKGNKVELKSPDEFADYVARSPYIDDAVADELDRKVSIYGDFLDTEPTITPRNTQKTPAASSQTTGNTGGKVGGIISRLFTPPEFT